MKRVFLISLLLLVGCHHLLPDAPTQRSSPQPSPSPQLPPPQELCPPVQTDLPTDENSEPKMLSMREVRYQRMPIAEFPEAAFELGIKDEMCKVKLTIDEQGVPISACIPTKLNENGESVPQCPPVFQEASVKGAMESRFYPYLEDGIPVKVKLICYIHFVSR